MANARTHTTDVATSSIGSLLVFLAAFGFSAKAILVKLAYVQQVDAVTLLALRMAFSLPFFLFMAKLSRPPRQPARLTPMDAVVVGVLGLLGYYVASFMDFLGLEFISAGLERLILFLYPTLVILLSALFLGQNVKGKELLALMLSYAGIGLVFYRQVSVGEPDVVLGATLVFGSTVSYAVYLMGSGRFIAKLGAARYTAYAMLIACIACLTQFAVSHPVSALDVPLSVYSLALAMAVFSTVLPSLFLSMGIQRIGASRAAMISSIGPVATIALAYMFLNETMGFEQLLGSLLVLVGVLAISLGKH